MPSFKRWSGHRAQMPQALSGRGSDSGTAQVEMAPSCGAIHQK